MVLVQLGTPDAPTEEAVRRYLGEFLTDRRVVDLGMRYGTPSLEAALDRVVDAGCPRVIVLPLFPQYGTATTASVLDAVTRWERRQQSAPELEFVRSFAAHPAYIDALAATVRAVGITPTPQLLLLLSFHGIPQRYADRGDPYPEECQATGRALATKLGLPADSWRIVYQSRFGREPWLRPYLDETLEALPGEGVRQVAVATPSFVADCLETIDEVGREARAKFLGAGGASFERVPCPNDRPEMLDALAAIVREHVS